ncbi:MAG: DinB family protein [Fibrobacterota bacterium]|nr:DinB family protein [Fibrobacterota bacterium]
MIDIKDSPFWKHFLQGDGGPSEPVAAFAAHADICGTYFAGIPEGRGDFRYAPEKWSVKQVVGHLTDANLVFLYRLVCISRGEPKSLPGFDENAYVDNARFDSQSWRHILEGYRAVALTTATLIDGLDRTAWERMGAANDVRLTPQNMLWVLMGHERHHIRILKERYGIA